MGDQQNKESYNNLRQATFHETNKIENELEKPQKQYNQMDIMERFTRHQQELQRQYNQISEENNQKLAQNSEPAVLNLCSSLASKKIMVKISSFAAQVTGILTREQKQQFNTYVSLIFNWLELNNHAIKEFMSESIAQVILFLVACKIDIKQKDFIKHLKPDIKNRRN